MKTHDRTRKRRLKRSLVIEELANAENIEVTDEQVSEEIERIRQNGQENPDPDSDETRDAVKRMLRRRAAMDRAVEIAREEKKPTMDTFRQRPGNRAATRGCR